MDATLEMLHHLTTNGYRVIFNYDDHLHGIVITADKEIDGQRLASSQIVPNHDWPFAALVLAEMRKELEAHERDD